MGSRMSPRIMLRPWVVLAKTGRHLLAAMELKKSRTAVVVDSSVYFDRTSRADTCC